MRKQFNGTAAQQLTSYDGELNTARSVLETSVHTISRLLKEGTAVT
jgi:hypothetical protein